MKIVVTGAAGMLGSTLVSNLSDAHHVTAVTHRTPLPAGLRPTRQVQWDLAAEPPAELREAADLWVHCAAYTSVDGAEQWPAVARKVNAAGTAAVVSVAADAGARVVYVSTDSVFDGTRGHYGEDDAPGPVNEYARSKLAGEEYVRAHAKNLVIRTNLVSRSAGLVQWLLNRRGDGKELKLFRDVVFNPIPADAFTPLLMALVERDCAGTVHLGSREVLSKAQFGRLVLAHAGSGTEQVRDADLDDAGLLAPRPRDTSLCTARARCMGLSMPSLDTLLSSIAQGNER
jgi:dTDP-4-dehydrorhamnose reductase